MLDNCAKRYVDRFWRCGGQCLATPEGKFDFLFDGKKCFFWIDKPAPDNIVLYPIVRWRMFSESDIAKWHVCLEYLTFEVTNDTLNNTTQMVKALLAETREHLRDYHMARVHCLWLRWIDDMNSDTFCSSTTSIPGLRCSKWFVTRSQSTTLWLLRCEANVPIVYEDTIIEHDTCLLW